MSWQQPDMLKSQKISIYLTVGVKQALKACDTAVLKSSA